MTGRLQGRSPWQSSRDREYADRSAATRRPHFPIAYNVALFMTYTVPSGPIMVAVQASGRGSAWQVAMRFPELRQREPAYCR